MSPEQQDGAAVQNLTIAQPALRVNVQFEDSSVAGVDVEVNDDPAGTAISAVNPQYIGDVVAAVLRAAAPVSRLRLTDPPRTAAPQRTFHEGGLVR